MDPATLANYHKFREAGARPVHALSAARTVARFRELEDAGVVRLRLEPEFENYFDVFGEPDDPSEKAILCDAIERGGLWYTASDYLDPSTGEWENADGCGMHLGYNDALDPFENWYVADEMAEAISKLEAAWSELEPDGDWHEAAA